ncbi:DUF4011 domain-containing anti-phage protein Hhe [Shewanella vesiculosa]|uniref:DUF4011 domain-containing anti-phage protein Hhe n=1 Tax=Shewanella vesiculosa TaxID=518738 RepID=UPI00384BF45C
MESEVSMDDFSASALNDNFAFDSLQSIRNRLLDLTNRNRLLNFKHTTSGLIRIIDEMPDQLAYELLENHQFKFIPVDEPTREQLIEHGYISIDDKGREVRIKSDPTSKEWAQILGLNISFDLPLSHKTTDKKHSDSNIQSMLYPRELEAQLRNIRSKANTAIEETGANILYLAFGFLEWFEDDSSDLPRQAPLYLIPVKIDKAALDKELGTYTYTIEYSGEDIIPNLSLSEKLKHDFYLHLPEINQESSPEQYFKHLQETLIHHKPKWKLKRFATLAMFDFGKLLMYLDLDPARWPAGKNNIQNHHILQMFFAKEGTENTNTGSGFSIEYPIDQVEGVHDKYPLIDDADSSQHSALMDAIKGKNLVIEGPPGSGKSQTITNLIAAAISQGKKVLFVAEKMAALQVVKSRLERAGLGDFCLELHSHKTQKKQVYENISHRISKQDKYRYPSTIAVDIAMYEEKKETLTQYANLINSEWKNTGRTIHQIFSSATRYREEFGFIPLDSIKPTQTTGELFDENFLRRISDSLHRYIDIYDQVKLQLGLEAELSEHPWFGVYNTSIQIFECDEICDLLKDVNNQLNQIMIGIKPVGDLIGDKSLDDIDILKLLFIDAKSLPIISGLEDGPALNAIYYSDEVESSCTSYLECYRACRDLYRKLTISFDELILIDANAFSRVTNSYNSLEQLCHDKELKLSSLFQIFKKVDDLNTLHLQLNEDIDILKHHQPLLSSHLDNTFNGLVDLNQYLKLACKLESVYITRRNQLFDNDLLDVHLPKLAEILPELKNLDEELVKYFDLTRLPSISVLSSINEALSNTSLLRWFDSKWRAAKKELILLSNSSSYKLKSLVPQINKLIVYKSLLDDLNGEPLYSTLLQSEYKGIETPINEIMFIRQWYKDVRSAFGVGFGKKVTFASTLFESDSEIFKGIQHLASNKTLLQLELFSVSHQELGEVLTHKIFIEHEIDFSHETLGLSSLSKQLEFDINVLQSVCKKDDSLIRLNADINGVKDFYKLEKQLNSQSLTGVLFVNQEILSAYEDCEQTEIVISSTLVLNQALKNLKSKSLINYYLSCPSNDLNILLSESLSSLEQCYDNYKQSFEIFSNRTDLDDSWYDINDTKIEVMIGRNQHAISQPRWLSTWVDFIRIRTGLVDNGLEKILRQTEKGIIDLLNLEKVYLYSVYDMLAREIINERQELAHFSGAEQNAIRKQFNIYDNKLKKLQQERIAFQVAKDGMKLVMPGISNGKVGSYSEMGLINHQVNLKTRHAPVRQLIKRAGHSLVKLKPCFMMGPHSVAQYLEPGQIEFDIIIMDEASQIKPEDALGTIARGKQLVVVGDPKQLPPTSFFDKAIEVDDEDITAIEQSESILDVSLPMFNARRLRWHYRSRHESLIAFSNQKFYDSNLVVFPSPSSESEQFGIKFTHVTNGRFVNQHNIEEAKVVAEAVRHHLLKQTSESLGVVAMSSKQREQIERCVEELSKDDVMFRDALAKNANVDEPLFIKNLENVQGDERDVIFISCTYGPQEAGAANMPQRFGPINSSAGGRRLNVLFTRSKKRMNVFSSMTEGHILASEKSSQGVHALKAFLAYAQTGKLAQQIHTGKQPDSDFEISVMNALAGEGFNCVPQVGVAGYFIDLAVQDPGQPGRYLMGIECDGATYHSAKSARDRDRLRQSVLEGLGWNIQRIWSTDWFKNPQAQLNPIIELLHQLKTEKVPLKVEDSIQVKADKSEYLQAQLNSNLSFDAESNSSNNDSLATKLEILDKKFISPLSSHIPVANRLLRPAMIAALCEFKPISKSEFLEMVPAYLRNSTSSEQGIYLEKVLNIIAETEQEITT